MKFHFTFEKLLQNRKREEELAMRDYLQARNRHDEAVALLDSYYESIGGARRMASDLHLSGGSQAESLKQTDEFIAGQQIRIVNQKMTIRALNQEMEEKHVVAIAKAQDSKVLEKLKEKLFARHKEAAKKREIKEMDDLVTMRFHLFKEDV